MIYLVKRIKIRQIIGLFGIWSLRRIPLNIPLHQKILSTHWPKK
jgi:hypothetical protein